MGRLAQSGDMDSCISTQALASALGLEFLPLTEKPYRLVLCSEHLTLAPVRLLRRILGRASFRRELAACTGYTVRSAGERLE